jgi:catechol 2,3-dioxygenase-like lactoylglutathione lyase family enzyme
MLLIVASLSTQAAVREIGTISLTVGDLNRELLFYTNTLPFELVSISEMHGKEQDSLLGLSNVKVRVAELQLGGERIQLTEHLVNKGKAVPADSRSYDHWFQHIAIVVRDMDAAYARLREHGVKHVSTGPQTLPDWNKSAGGIKAFYFRDPEDHVLEIIYFPAGKGDPKWQQPTDKVFLGIDHTAIVVSDTEKSLRFYRDALGLRVAGESENYGIEQEHLNQVFGARLHITGLRAEKGPGIEFLEYITPPGGRGLPDDAKANDLVFWNTHLVADDLPQLRDELKGKGTTFVSKAGNQHSQIVRDPDGHAIELDDTGGTSVSAK